jgi:ABC-type Fe3+ transport system permease subunit
MSISYPGQLAWTLLRALLVAAVVASLARPVAVCLADRWRGHLRRVAATLIVAPLLMPRLVVAYAYTAWPGAQRLAYEPGWNEILYGLLIGSMLLPVAVGVFLFAPRPALSAEASFCRRLLPRTCAVRRGGLRGRLGFALRGEGRTTVVAAAAVFLLAFTEFEVASLFGLPSWTVWLFDAQAAGLPLGATFARALVPAALELLILAAALVLVVKTSQRRGQAAPLLHCPAARSRAWIVLLPSFAIACLFPLLVMFKEAWPGAALLMRDFSIGWELLMSVLFAAGGASLALLAAAAVRRGGRAGLIVGLVACAPALCGSVVVGLLILCGSAWEPISPILDTPIPILAGLAWLLLPVALVLGAILHAVERPAGVHVAELLRRSAHREPRRAADGILWALCGRGRFWVGLLLFFFCYFELVLSALLAPTGMTPATVPLYSFMHYGHSAKLCAMVLLMAVVPLMLIGAAAALRPALWRCFNTV